MIKPFVIAGDNHGNEAEGGMESAFFEWLKDYKPKIRIHSGDNWNFSALRKKATEAERTIAIAPDFEAGTDFIKRLFDGGESRVFLRGNHDERIYNTAHHATDAALIHYAGKVTQDIATIMSKRKARMLPYDSRLGVLDEQGVRGIHGFASGIGAARKFAFVFGSCFFGHTHAMDICPVERWPDPAVAHGTGCFQKLDQPYNSTQIGKLRHENGWLYGFTDGKSATYFQAKFKHGKVYVAENIKAY